MAFVEDPRQNVGEGLIGRHESPIDFGLLTKSLEQPLMNIQLFHVLLSQQERIHRPFPERFETRKSRGSLKREIDFGGIEDLEKEDIVALMP